MCRTPDKSQNGRLARWHGKVQDTMLLNVNIRTFILQDVGNCDVQDNRPASGTSRRGCLRSQAGVQQQQWAFARHNTARQMLKMTSRREFERC